MAYRTFIRTWWADIACTKPKAGRKFLTGHRFDTEQEARDFCRDQNLMRYGATMSGAYGWRMEYEAI